MFSRYVAGKWPLPAMADALVATDAGAARPGLSLMRLLRWLASGLLLALLLLGSQYAAAASACTSPRSIIVVAGEEFYEDYYNSACSPFGLTGTLVAPLHGTLENSNETNAVRYRNTDLNATSDTFTVRDDSAQPIVYNVTITPAITLSPTTVANGTVGLPYASNLSATGGAEPYTFLVTSGALPAGLTLSDTTGLLSGTPTAGGMFVFTVRATDSLAKTGERSYGLSIFAPTISIAPTAMLAMTAGVAFSQNITASGGTATYSYAATGGTLPTGLNLAQNGALSGTPTAAGSFSFTITATDSSTGNGAPYTGSRAYSGTVAAGAPVAGNVNTNVAYGSNANPITLSLSGGAPTSVAVASAASHGTATASGTSITYTPAAGYGGPDSFTYTATNGVGTSAPATVAVTVIPPTITIAPGIMSAATVGSAYSQVVIPTNGKAPYAYAISAGALPAGMTLSDTTGLLSGTPTAGGTFTFTVRVTDSSTGTGPYVGVQNYTMTVSVPTISIVPISMPAMTAGVAFSQNITASGGTATYSYAATGGTLPTGLSLAQNGTLSGTPTAAGPFSFTITATDSSTGTGAPYTGSRAYSVTVAAGAPVAGNANANVAYGSNANPITLSLSGGAPTSVAVASAASHGTATASGTSITYTPAAGYGGPDSFTYTATNGVGTSAAATVTVTVGVPTVVIGPVSLPAMTVGQAFNQELISAGGTASYSYAVTAGALPAGLTQDATGRLTGTPTTAGAFSFEITATDSSTGDGPYRGVLVYSG